MAFGASLQRRRHTVTFTTGADITDKNERQIWMLISCLIFCVHILTLCGPGSCYKQKNNNMYEFSLPQCFDISLLVASATPSAITYPTSNIAILIPLTITAFEFVFAENTLCETAGDLELSRYGEITNTVFFYLNARPSYCFFYLSWRWVSNSWQVHQQRVYYK